MQVSQRDPPLAVMGSNTELGDGRCVPVISACYNAKHKLTHIPIFSMCIIISAAKSLRPNSMPTMNAMLQIMITSILNSRGHFSVGKLRSCSDPLVDIHVWLSSTTKKAYRQTRIAKILNRYADKDNYNHVHITVEIVCLLIFWCTLSPSMLHQVELL